jgi:hypothetical protein
MTFPNALRILFVALLAITTCCLTIPGSARAQATDASITGTVSDGTGEVLPGATVIVTNATTGFETGTVTNAQGHYTFKQLPLGSGYAITVSFIGFGEQRKSGFDLQLGDRLTIDFELSQATTELEEIIVTADDLRSRIERLGGTTAILDEQIEALPAQDRNFTDLASLAPQFGPSFSLSGQRRMSTNVTVDGMNARNQLTGGELARGPFTISMEAIREFEVITNTYDVTIGRQGGGSINAATKSGTNVLEGTAFAYQRSDELRSGTDFQGRELDEFQTTQWGFSLGGPIVNDELHFFVAFDRQDETIPYFVSDVRTQSDALRFNITQDNLDRVVNILRDEYGMSSEPQYGSFDRATTANTLFTRLDWQLSDKHQLTLRNNYSDWEEPSAGGGDRTLTLAESRWSFRDRILSSLLSLRSSFTPSFTNELKVQYQNAYREYGTEVGKLPRGWVQVESELPDGSTGVTEIQFGGHRWAPETNLERQLHLTNTAYLSRGDINFTFGTDNMITYLDTWLSNEQGGLFRFASIEDLANKDPFRYRREAPLEGTSRSTAQQQYVLDGSLFGQVELEPLPHVRATAGLRWDVTNFLSSPDANPLVEEELGLRTDVAPTDWDNLQPRLQLTWDVGGRERDIVRLGAGAFASQPHYYAHVNHMLNSGTVTGNIFYDVSQGDAIPEPNFERFRDDLSAVPGYDGGELPPPFLNVVSEDFEVPMTWKANLSYNRFLGDGLRVGVNLLYSRVNNNYHYFDRNLVETPAFSVDPDDRPVFVPASTIDPETGITNAQFARKTDALGRVLELTSEGEARQYGVVLDAAAQLPKGGFVSASYTWNRSEDNTSYNCCVANTATFTPVERDPRDLTFAPADNDFRHKVAAYASTPRWRGFQLSARYIGISGQPLYLKVNSDINGDGDQRARNDLAFIFDPDDPATPAGVAEGMRNAIANADPRVAEYLRENLGTRAERNGLRNGFQSTVDLRFTKQIGTFGNQSAEVVFDLFNALNLLNSEWGGRTVYGSSRNLLNVQGFDPETQEYEYSVNESVGVGQEVGDVWRMQLGVRYNF